MEKWWTWGSGGHEERLDMGRGWTGGKVGYRERLTITQCRITMGRNEMQVRDGGKKNGIYNRARTG